MTQSLTSVRMASFPVMTASNFLLRMRLIVSVNRRSTVVSMALVEGVVSVLEELFASGVVFEGNLSVKVTRALIGLDLLDFPLVIFEMKLIGSFSG